MTKDIKTKKKSTTRDAIEGLVFIILAAFLFSVPKMLAYHPNSLEGYFLVSQNNDDKNSAFYKTVIFLSHHDKKSAVGYIINMPLAPVPAKDLYDELEIRPLGRFTNIFTTPAYAETFVNDLMQTPLITYWGGPMESDDDKARLIFANKYTKRDTKKIADTDVKISPDMQAINKILKKGNKAEPYKIVIGYTGWGEGQLDREIAEKLWLVVPYSYDALFTNPANKLWDKLSSKLSNINDK